MEEQIRYIGDLQRVEVRPGDRFVLTVDDRMTDEGRKNVQKIWEVFAGEDAPKLLVLEKGMKLGVFGDE